MCSQHSCALNIVCQRSSCVFGTLTDVFPGATSQQQLFVSVLRIHITKHPPSSQSLFVFLHSQLPSGLWCDRPATGRCPSSCELSVTAEPFHPNTSYCSYSGNSLFKNQRPSAGGLTLPFSSLINEGDHNLSHLIKLWLPFKNVPLSHNPDINL